MKTEHPIIFSTDMVKAILERRATQTRRVIKPQPVSSELEASCPYGREGNTLWVRETWSPILFEVSDSPAADIIYRADWNSPLPYSGKWKSPCFMPRWASRITLRITEVSPERLQDITVGGYMLPSDVHKEGCPVKGDIVGEREAQWFIALWDSINAKRGFGWGENPWVWVITFEKEKKR